MIALSLFLVAASAQEATEPLWDTTEAPAETEEAAPVAPTVIPEVAPPAPKPQLDVTEVALGAGFGFIYQNLEPLNELFRSKGYPEYGAVQITPLSVNGDLWANRHVPGFDYITYTNAFGPGDVGGHTTHFRFSLTQLSYGYAVVHTKGFSLVPKLGIGIANTEVKIQPTGPIGFGDVIDDPTNAFTMTKSSFVLDLGVNISYLIALGGADSLGIKTGLRWTIRVGGLVQLFDTQGGDMRWTSEGNAVRDAMDVRLDGFYARLMFFPSLLHRSVHSPKAPKQKKRK